jgi:Cu2+-containing amine oxidase
MVAQGVNAQIQKEMFVARLDVAFDSRRNNVSDFTNYSEPPSETNPYGSAFGPKRLF